MYDQTIHAAPATQRERLPRPPRTLVVVEIPSQHSDARLQGDPAGVAVILGRVDGALQQCGGAEAVINDCMRWHLKKQGN